MNYFQMKASKTLMFGIMVLLLTGMNTTDVTAQFKNDADMIFAGTSYNETYNLTGTPTVMPYKAKLIGNNEYQLTESKKWQSGSIWSKNYIDLHNSFTIEGAVNLGISDGADGIAFVLQPFCTGLGQLGEGIGYGGIKPSFAIEFDNHSNYFDPKTDHIGFSLNGNYKEHLSGTMQEVGKELENGKYHDITINWDAPTKTMTLTIFNPGTKDVLKTISKKQDFAANFPQTNGLVYWGFTSATGLSHNEHKVKLSKWPDANIYPYNVTDATTGKENGKIEMNMMDNENVNVKYAWNNNKGVASTISELAAGNYKVTATSTFTINGKSQKCVSSFDITVGALPELIGHWTFEDGKERTDLTGNFETLTLVGGTTIKDGNLNVSQAKWAITNLVEPKVIRAKTLVAWVNLDDINARGGSVLTYETGNRDFDGIIYAEKNAAEWMSGSDIWSRTNNNNGGSKYTTKKGELVQVAITYADNNTITIYRNGVQVTSYAKGKMIAANNSTDNTASVLFGMRHTPMVNGVPGGGAWFVGSIEEARIYNGVLTGEQIKQLSVVK